jgi:hypothetical protein
MPRAIVMEEFHVTVYVPHGLPEAECRAIRPTLEGATFHGQLRRAIQEVFGRYRSLAKTRVRLTQ